MIASVHSKSCNSSGFNPILQKFYEMICEMIVSKTMCGTFLIFCRSSLINYGIYCEEQLLGTLKSLKLKYLETHLFKKKFLHITLKIISAQIRWKNFFSGKFFLEDLELFSQPQKQWFRAHFFPQKINFIPFFKCDYLILMWYYKNFSKIYLEKLWKIDDSTLLNIQLEPYKLP